MKLPCLIALIPVLLVGCASGPRTDEHAAHRAGAADAVAGANAVDEATASFHALHARLRAASTPEERAAVRLEQHKLMQTVMARMASDHAGTAGAARGPDAAHGHHALMQAMMQTMMACEPAAAPR